MDEAASHSASAGGAESAAPGAKKSPKKVFGVVGLAIFTFAFLANVNTTPQLSTFGLGSIILFLAAIVLFLGPTAMASAEMGSTWPRTGGLYVWTRLAFGEATAFMIIWLEFANFVVAWPGIMGSISSQASYPIDPNLDNNPMFIIPVVIAVTWAAAWFALRGLRVAKGFAWYAVVAGTLLPAVILVGFAIHYLSIGRKPAMEVSAEALIPHIDATNIAFLSGALLMFSGIEISAIHSGDIENPGKTIPRSNLIAVVLCFVLFAPLTLALAVMVPSGDMNIVAGLVQAGEKVFDQFNVGWMTAVFTVLLVTGAAASLIQIISGPSRGLLVAGRVGGNLPPFLQKENKLKMPVAIILAQAVISSVLALGYGLLGSVQNAWFIFSIVQTNMTLVLYGIMFAAVVKLRFSRPNVDRPYRIPGKLFGLYAVVGVGMIVCLLGIMVSLFPTVEAQGMSTPVYIAVVVLGTGAFLAMPFAFWLFRKPSWKTDVAEDADDFATDEEALT